MKKTGIWIDSQQAWIYQLEDAQEQFEQVSSQVEDTHPGGGYGGAKAYGPQVASPEDKIQRRKAQQFKEFFNEVEGRIRKSDAVLIEGPAEAKLGLLQYLKERPDWKQTKVEIRTADKRTENQFKAEIKAFFED